MRRFLILFALALIPIQVILYLVWQYYSIPLTLSAALWRMLGGAAAAGYIAWRIDRQMGGKKPKSAKAAPETTLYQRPTFDQMATLAGKAPDPAPPQDTAPEAPPASGAPMTLAERLRQQQTKRD
jgi:hypothetical protein